MFVVTCCDSVEILDAAEGPPDDVASCVAYRVLRDDDLANRGRGKRRRSRVE